MFFTVLGILSSILLIIANCPYIMDTIKGKTKPERVTWGVIFLLNAIGFANQVASGATNSLWLFGSAVLGAGTIFGLSLFKGVGGHTRLDIITIVTALAGLALWIIFDNPTFSIIATVVVGIAALLPTFAKAKKHPETETKITWLLGSISSFLGLISVGTFDWRLMALPLNGALLQANVVRILYFGKKPPKKS